MDPRRRRTPLPEILGRAALGLSLAAVALAALGLLAGEVLGLALLGRGALQVALGGSIAAGTLAAVALLAARGQSAALRRRAGVAGGLAVALLLGLLALPSLRFGGELVVPAPGADVAAGPPPAAQPADADRPSAVRTVRAAEGPVVPIAVDAPPERAFDAALATARALGWTAEAVDAEARRFEARDAAGGAAAAPLTVRVEPAPGGAVVTLAPREGEARPAPARVRAFSERLRATVAAGA